MTTLARNYIDLGIEILTAPNYKTHRLFGYGFLATAALSLLGIGPDLWHHMLLGFVIAHTIK